MLPLEVCDGVSLVGGGIIQQQDERAAQVTQPFAYKTADLLLADVVEEEQVVEAQPMPAWAERNAGDDTDLVPPSLAMAMDGRLSRGSPGAHHVGDEHESRFVGKH